MVNECINLGENQGIIEQLIQLLNMLVILKNIEGIHLNENKDLSIYRKHPSITIIF
jgi:hypothetical protein